MKLSKALRKAAEMGRESVLVSPRGVIYAFNGELLLARKPDGTVHHWVVDHPESAVALGRYQGKKPWYQTHKRVALHLEAVQGSEVSLAVVEDSAGTRKVPRVNRPE